MNHFSRRGVGALEPGRPAASRPGASTATTTPGSTRTATDYEFLPRRRPRPRAAAQLRRAAARLLPRPRRRLRGRAAGLRQLQGLRRPRRRSPSSSSSTRCSSAPGNRSRTPMLVGTNNARADPRAAADRRPSRTRSPRTWPPASRCTAPATPHRAPLDVRLHARRARGRAKARPRSPTTSASRSAGRAAPTRCSSGSFWRVAHRPVAARLRPLRAADALLPDRRDRLGARGAQRACSTSRSAPAACVVPAQPVADALRRRRRAAGRPVLLQPPSQRQPAREGGLGGRCGHADLGPLGADLLLVSLAAVLLRRRDRVRDHARRAAPRARTRCAPSASTCRGLRLRRPAGGLASCSGHDHASMRAWALALAGWSACCRWRSGRTESIPAAAPAARPPARGRAQGHRGATPD